MENLYKELIDLFIPITDEQKQKQQNFINEAKKILNYEEEDK